MSLRASGGKQVLKLILKFVPEESKSCCTLAGSTKSLNEYRASLASKRSKSWFCSREHAESLNT